MVFLLDAINSKRESIQQTPCLTANGSRSSLFFVISLLRRIMSLSVPKLFSLLELEVLEVLLRKCWVVVELERWFYLTMTLLRQPTWIGCFIFHPNVDYQKSLRRRQRFKYFSPFSLILDHQPWCPIRMFQLRHHFTYPSFFCFKTPLHHWMDTICSLPAFQRDLSRTVRWILSSRVSITIVLEWLSIPFVRIWIKYGWKAVCPKMLYQVTSN